MTAWWPPQLHQTSGNQNFPLKVFSDGSHDRKADIQQNDPKVTSHPQSNSMGIPECNQASGNQSFPYKELENMGRWTDAFWKP